VFDFFKRYSEHSYFPVLDGHDRPLGLICEHRLKTYIYSSYGRDLIANRAYRKELADFLEPCPSADVNSTAERLLEIYSSAEQPPGIIMTDDFVYAGFLSEGALLRLIDQKNLAVARDQNPLTRLPGNNSIVAYVSRVLDVPGPPWMLAYLDFDHFKPFNDHYGFRQGDRAITLFAELLRKHLPHGGFAGHIGGDDFFAGVEGLDASAARAVIGALLRAFAHEVQSFYDAEARTRGWISSRDRSGRPARYPLLRCSAAIVLLPSGPRTDDLDALARRIAVLKKRAKAAEDGISLLDPGAASAAEHVKPQLA
jgi:diguanylate cyclase (GGDEF)-like protein